MTDYQVRLKGDDGKEYLITYESLAAKLRSLAPFEEKFGWNAVTKQLRKDIEEITELILSIWLIPAAKEKLRKIISENPNIETRKLNRYRSGRGLEWVAWYKAFQELEENKQIIGVSQGRGRNRKWRVNK